MDFDAVSKIGFSDMTLLGVRWDVAQPDVILSVELGDGTGIELRCVLARDVRIALDKRQRNAGPALSWDGAVTAAADGTYDVAFDFAGDGVVSLKCDKVEVETVSKPSRAADAHEMVDVWSDGASVQVRAVTAFGDPVDMGTEEAREYARRILAAADETDAS